MDNIVDEIIAVQADIRMYLRVYLEEKNDSATIAEMAGEIT